MRISGLVLAGGRGERFGQNKALISIKDQPLIEIIIKRVEDLFDEVMIIGDLVPAKILPYIKHIQDVAKYGPLGGIYTGLLNSKTEYNFVIGCDMPLVNREFVLLMINRLKEGYELIIPKSARGLEPLHSIYSKGCLKYIEEQLSKGDLKLMNLIKKIDKVKYIDRMDWAESSFFNINTQQDLRWLLKERNEYAK